MRPVIVVRNFGIYLVGSTAMEIHIAKTVSGCFAAIKRIRSIRRHSVMTLELATGPDYGNPTPKGSRSLLGVTHILRHDNLNFIFVLCHRTSLGIEFLLG